MRRSLGLAVVGGLLLSQLLTLYVTPVVYLALDALERRARAGLRGRRPAVAEYAGARRRLAPPADPL